MAKVETDILSWSDTKPLVWKRFLDDIFVSREEIAKFIEQADKHHATIRFTAEISETETTFLHTTVYKGERFKKDSVLDLRTHFKPIETFHYTHFTLCHPPGVKRGFVKGEALRLLRTNSSKELFEKKTEKTSKKNSSMGVIQNFFLQRTLSEVEDGKQALQQKRKENKRILPFVTQFQPSVPNLKQILISKWHLITNRPLLKKNIWGASINIILEKGRFLHDILVKAKLW